MDINEINDKKFRAQVLIEALPYIQDYNGKIIVVKYGGNAMINEQLKMSVMRDIVLLNLIGVKVVLVHGGGPEISEMLKKSRQGIRVCRRASLYGRGNGGNRTHGTRGQNQ